MHKKEKKADTFTCRKEKRELIQVFVGRKMSGRSLSARRGRKKSSRACVGEKKGEREGACAQGKKTSLYMPAISQRKKEKGSSPEQKAFGEKRLGAISLLGGGKRDSIAGKKGVRVRRSSN